MTEEMKREKLQAIIDEASTSDILYWWNERCDYIGCSDDYIYYMGELDEIFSGKSATDIINALADDFSTGDEYFKDDIWGVESFDDIYDVVDDDELIDYILQADEDFGESDIRDILDEELTDEEEGE